MTALDIVATAVGLALALAALGALFTRLVALPYLKAHLVDPFLALLDARLDAMHAKDAELEIATRLAATMFEGHMTASEIDRGRLWEAVTDLRRHQHNHP